MIKIVVEIIIVFDDSFYIIEIISVSTEFIIVIVVEVIIEFVVKIFMIIFEDT